MKDNDLRYLIFLLLLTFILSAFTSGCSSLKYDPAKAYTPTPRDCKAAPWDDRCRPYIPEPKPEYDSNETFIDEEFSDE